MITLFSIFVNKQTQVTLKFVEGDVDYENMSNRLRYSVVNSPEVYTIILSVFSLLNIPEDEVSRLSDMELQELVQMRVNRKIPNGYWFKIPISKIAEGNSSADNNYTVPSIGFGVSEEEAQQDALNRITYKLHRAHSTGQRLNYNGAFTFPCLGNHYIKDKELREYLLVDGSKSSLIISAKKTIISNYDIDNSQCREEENELTQLLKENEFLKKKVSELESQINRIKTAMQELMQGL